jgi:RNA polymerase sigma-70 factor (ECF subfamily)
MTRTRPDLRVIPGGAAASAEAPAATAPKGTRAPGTATRERGSVLQDLYSRYGGTVYGRCFYLLKDRAKAEDAMQDVFAKVLTNLAGFRAEASPLTWLVAITTNHCLNVLRAEKAGWRQRYADEEIARVDAVETRSGPRLLEDREAVRRLLARVDLETQAAAIHYYVDEMTLEEVATALGRSVPTVRKRLETFATLSRQEVPS